MARIRTIKPDFWTDEKIVQLPYEARLLFIGLWNFCDDEGYPWDEPERIKLQVLPNDNASAASLLDLLHAASLVNIHITDSGRRAIYIPHFPDHQKVSHPAASRIAPECTRKLTIPTAARRALAKKYGCVPGQQVNAECYYCGMGGSVIWWNKPNGEPSPWVNFKCLEIDHLVAESNGGETAADNFVLACRECNRSKHSKSLFEYLVKTPEESGVLSPEGKGTEGNGREGKGYVFDGVIIRLTSPDFDRLKSAYHAIPDMVAELTAIDSKFTADPPPKWFPALNGWLKKEHERRLAAPKVSHGYRGPEVRANVKTV